MREQQFERALDGLRKEFLHLTVKWCGGNREDAEDILQETTVRVWQNRHKLDNDFKAFFRKIWFYQVLRHRRKLKSRANVLGQAISLDTPAGWEAEQITSQTSNVSGSIPLIDRIGVFHPSAEDAIIEEWTLDQLFILVEKRLTKQQRSGLVWLIEIGLRECEIAKQTGDELLARNMTVRKNRAIRTLIKIARELQII